MKLLYIWLMTIVIALVNCETDNEWTAFKSKHKKTYINTKEETFRRNIWLNRRSYIINFNQQKGDLKLKLNEFSDWSESEILSTKFGFDMSSVRLGRPRTPAPTVTTKQTSKTKNSQSTSTSTTSRTSSKPATFSSIGTKSNSTIAATTQNVLNYTAMGYVTVVKNQGNCGSCWAFAATGALEGQYFKKYGKLLSFSEQHLVDCSSSYGNYGCGGGNYAAAYQYISDNKGINDEATYPYKALYGTCAVKKTALYVNALSYVYVQQNNELILLQALINNGPIAVAIDASKPSFWNYGSGIYYEANCSSTVLNHAVLVVGYGTENGQDYWLVKNSWGTTWGMNGYIKMSRNRNNNCGIAAFPVYPVV